MTTIATKALTPWATKAVDVKARTFEGLASTWDLDLGGDVIHQGAFTKTLENWRENDGRIVPLIDHHRYGSAFDVLGKMTHAEETDEGLSARFEVVNGDDGDRLLERIKGGYLNGLSIGYEAIAPQTETITREDGVKETIRHLREIKLYEVSAVIWGMNPHALIERASVKSVIDALKSGDLTSQELEDLRAFLQADPPKGEPEPDEPQGIAPDDARRLKAEAVIRDLAIRSLAA